MLWEVWKAWNAAKFSGTTPSNQVLRARIAWWLNYFNKKAGLKQAQPPSKNRSLYPRYSPLFSLAQISHPISIVRWQRPPAGWVRLNVDGSSLGNLGPSGGGGLCRDSSGGFLFAFAKGYGTPSNTHAELRAVHEDLCLSLSKGYHQIIIESDLELIVRFLSGAATPGWNGFIGSPGSMIWLPLPG
ncbi:uncharacterized protein LOC131230607 [Magnolia sinica]|uniref:uncharacterized protein LOC131230607 n=1 Tax=Magnolia sinica TaxID=86752 RepID=UPI00265A3835|nr:uncharacterized protein LOC131230607 [Magnolia sinica]